MSHDPPESTELSKLRDRAETSPRLPSDVLPETSVEGIEKQVHELQSRQIELEIQNEELRQAWMKTGVLNENGHGVAVVSIGRDITECRRAEEAVRESEERFRSIFEHSTIGMYRTTPDGRIVMANPALISMLGYSSFEELARLNLEEEGYAPNHPRSAFKQRIESEGRVTGLEAAWVASDGSTLFVRESARAVRDADGNTLYYEGTVEDVSDRKKVEDVLRRYRKIFECSRDGIVVVDNAGRVLDANEALCKMLGYSLDELRGMKDFHQITPERWREWEAQEIVKNRLLRRGYSDVYEKEYVGKDGNVFPVELQSYAVFGEDGSPLYLWGLVRDITDRKVVDEEIKKFRTVSDRAVHGNAIVDLQGNLIYTNDYFARVHGYISDELIGRSLSAFHNEKQMETVHQIHEYLMKEGSYGPIEVWHTHKDGTEFPMLMSGIVIRDVSGKSEYVATSAIDITERKRAEEELARAKEAAEAANRAKSTFLANMSHEIRTPMTAIMGFSSLLMSVDYPSGERREYLQTIHRNAENLLALINDILDVSKIEAEKIELEPSECSPRQIVEDVRSLVQVQAGKNNLRLDADFASPLPKTIRTDPTRLRQILVNLVGNAIKFTETGGVKIRVRLVRAQHAPPRLEFEVTDTGIGMSEEEIGRLFQPFTQADPSNTRRFGGTGLGLHISKKLAEMLGGRIEVRSEPGVGSSFTLTVDPGPLENVAVEAPTRAACKEEKSIATRHKRKLNGRILFTEDVEEVRTLVGLYLERTGLDVDSAENGRIALEMASASRAEGRPYDLILMDIQMPELDGHEVTRRLRRDGWEGPILALTACAMTGDRERCLEAGCDDYIPKPMTDEELFGAVARHLDMAIHVPAASAGT